jgi:hypothetical protein
MITKEQILAATGEELSRLAGEVLRGTHDNMGGRCKKCLLCCEYQKPPFGCHVDITWPEAMKYFMSMYKKHGKAKMLKAMQEVYVSATGDTNGIAYVLDWWPFGAGVEGNLKAAAICEVNNT